jgi:nicotinate phosphoribosyltransferase
MMVNLLDRTKQMRLPRLAESNDLLVPIFKQGRLVYELPSLEQIRHRRMVELMKIADGTKRFENPDEYRAGLEKSLYIERENLMLEHRGISDWEYEAAERVSLCGPEPIYL